MERLLFAHEPTLVDGHTPPAKHIFQARDFLNTLSSHAVADMRLLSVHLHQGTLSRAKALALAIIVRAHLHAPLSPTLGQLTCSRQIGLFVHHDTEAGNSSWHIEIRSLLHHQPFACANGDMGCWCPASVTNAANRELTTVDNVTSRIDPSFQPFDSCADALCELQIGEVLA